jgi:hypothetical protein
MVRPMKASLHEITDYLGLDHPPQPYDSYPWSAYDTEKSLTCNAEARMDADGKIFEVEIQFIYDTPPAGGGSIEQIMYMKIDQQVNGKWAPALLRIKKDLMSGKIHDWEKKGCEFFTKICLSLARNEVPDIDDLIEKIFKAAENMGGGTAGGGSRKPMIRPEQLFDPTKKF